MKLVVTNTHTTLDQTTAQASEHRAYLKGLLSYTVTPHRGHPYKQSFLSIMDNSFPSGLLSFVMQKCREDNYYVELLDIRAPAKLRSGVDLSWLRDYQREAFDAALSHTRGIISMGTGTGKGAIMAALVATADCPVLVVTPGVTLLHQFQKKLAEYTGIKAGRVGDGHREWSANVVVGTPESVFGHMEAINLSRFGMAIYDEVHSLACEDHQAILSRCTSAYYRFGFSATPLSRTDQRDAFTIGQLGDVIYNMPAAEAVRRGIIAAPSVLLMRYESPTSPVLPTDPHWSLQHDAMISENTDRSATIVRWLRTAPKPALVFVKETAHVREIISQLLIAKIPANWVIGPMNKKDREAAVNLLTIGAVEVMVATAAFRQAVDIPCLRTVVNAGGGEAEIDVIQKLGRGVRKVDGKDAVTVMDVHDVGCVYCAAGFVHPCCRSVATHSAKRRGHYVSAGFMVTEIPAP